MKDQSGALVPGTSITIRNTTTNEERQVKTDENGEYTVPELPPGPYLMIVEKEGFHRVEQTGLTLEIDQTAQLDFTLQLGAVSDAVEVTASVPLLNTESSMKGDVIVAREMTDIPLDGRDFADLAYLVPGVSQKAQGGNGSNFAVNGARTDNTNFIIDGFNDQNPRGGSAQARPPVDAMMEFKMQTTGYSAEYGRLAGGTMNMALKSGTNLLHGTLFEFVRNDAFDARGFFDPYKTSLRRNQFGAVLDGPVYIPKIYNGRNRTFFLFDWEAYRQVNGNSNITTVPSLAERAGDFTHSLDVNGRPASVADPFSSGATGACVAGKKGSCFPGNIIPASRLDSIAMQVMKYYPLPTSPGVANNFYTVTSDPDYWDSFVGKVDQRLFTSDNLSVRFLKRFNRNTNPYNGSPTGVFGDSVSENQSLGGITYTRLFGPNLINESRVGFTRTAHEEYGFKMGTDYAAQWGLQGSTSSPDMVGFPRFTVTNMAPLGNGGSLPIIYHVTNYQFANTLTWVKGKHMAKFGGDLLRTQFFQPYYNNNRGTYAFNGYWTSVPIADFDLGVLNQVTRTVGTNPDYLFWNSWGFFAQDDYRVSSSLTLNIGLRYEIPMPPHEKYGRMANFVPELGQLVISSDETVPNLAQLVSDAGLTGKVVLAKDVGFPSSLIFSSYKQLAPRFGFAWRPFGGTKTVIRGGYGIFYGSNQWNPVRNDLANVYPFSIAQTLNKNTSNPSLLTLQNPLAAKINLNGVLTPNGFQAYPTPQYLQSWNTTLEREIGNAMAIEISYTGSKGTHLGRKYNVNMPFRIPGTQVNGNFPRPIAGFNDIDYYSFGGNSIYNAGMITLRKRMARGFFYRLNYIYSKSIDSASQISDSSAGGIGAPQNARCLACERGRSDWDRGHMLTALFLYDIPLRKHLLFRDWQITGTGRFSTGQPFTPQVNGVQLDQGEANRPDRIAKGTLPNPKPDMWFDLSAFPPLPASTFRFGNAGRNILDGPGLISLNLALIRRFKIRERYNFQFRCESFNALNHANFNLPDNIVNSPTGGTITATGDPRLFQLGMKMQF